MLRNLSNFFNIDDDNMMMLNYGDCGDVINAFKMSYRDKSTL